TFLRAADGNVVGVQGLLRDVTDRRKVEEERKALERELRQTEKLKAIGQLAGGIAHDFNNQLAPILAHADLLARGLVDSESIVEHARRIVKPAQNAADLTAKLLAFARRGSYEHRPLDLHEVINDVAEILAHGIDRRIVVKRHYEASSAVVAGDRTRLQNVLLNLALNARDAMPSGGEIVFKTRMIEGDGNEEDPSKPDSWLEVRVEDTGEGMDESVRERAFEPFFTTKPLGKGTGMGLAAAFGTVTAHGGTIEIDSLPGRGTAVAVRLPATGPETGVRADSFAEKLTAVGGRVILVDDEDDVRSALTDLLESLGFSVTGFERGRDATTYFAAHPSESDFVILDLVLPDISGREVLAELQETDPSVRVLLVSGYTADEEISRILESPTVEFLEKPFLLADLAEALTRLNGSR
ncbi:MAG: ATP-binding protein, partial [Candidatus Sulfomarinibacteraceae bacterium]